VVDPAPALNLEASVGFPFGPSGLSCDQLPFVQRRLPADEARSWLDRALALQRQGEPGLLAELLRHFRHLALAGVELNAALVPLFPHWPAQLLHPKFLPAELLADPSSWSPEASGVNRMALAAAHPASDHPGQLLESGLLLRILIGQEPLYRDLPPVAIQAYASQLRHVERRRCRDQHLSAFTHLASIGWSKFRSGQSFCKGLDRYLPPVPDPPAAAPVAAPPQLLVVIDADHAAACRQAAQGGWTEVEGLPISQLSQLHRALAGLHPSTLVSFCHCSDQLDPDAATRIAVAAAAEPQAALLSSDETHRWSDDPVLPAANRQCRVAVTPFRLLCRGAIGGLVTLPVHQLRSLDIPQSRTCLHALCVDLALQLAARGEAFGHCKQVLLARDLDRNPTVPDVAVPRDQQRFTGPQSQEILEITQRRAHPLLAAGGRLESHPLLPGCHRLRFEPAEPPLVSILIPFRDGVQLTQACVASIRRSAGAIPYELVLIDNGSSDPETVTWLESLQDCRDIQVVNLDCPFNFSRINNIARQACRGDFLLFLNNDVEFQGVDVLASLLDPFAYGHTWAVGARLRYPDGAIQHQGVVLIKGERRALLEPGKMVDEAAVLQTITPLCVQEEFSAATGACLLVRAERFDQVGGFDESFVVTFNDVDLCLRLRAAGGAVVVTPEPCLIHRESVSRGKDSMGSALVRQQQEQGLLRQRHALLYANGDPLTSDWLHPHSSQYELRRRPEDSLLPVSSGLVYSWRRPGFRTSPQRPLLLFAQFAADGRLRADILPLLKAYGRHADVVFVAATPALRNQPHVLRALQRVCAVVLVRHNQGYDFGSWMAAMRFCADDLPGCRELILTNDSFWGPVRPMQPLFDRLDANQADVVGLTDNLLYEPHLQSAFVSYRPSVLASDAFRTFWADLPQFAVKRALVKHCEVGLPVALRAEGFELASLYATNAFGNVLHFRWRSLIEEQDFPFLKVSLLRDNPTGQDVSGWIDVVSAYNPALARHIAHQLNPKPPRRPLLGVLRSLLGLAHRFLPTPRLL
jgi:O-antigen biosynthesis protein